MKVVSINNIDIHYSMPRSLDNSKIPLLMIHGAFGSKRHWEPLSSLLSSHTIPISLDLPGHGHSQGFIQKSIPEAANFIEKFLEVLNISNPICLVGHSVGGLIGLQFTLSFPHLIRCLILLSTSASINLHPFLLDQAVTGNWDYSFLSSSFDSDVHSSVRDLVLQDYKFVRVSGNEPELFGTHNIDLRDSISKLSVPTLILSGNDDIIISPRKSVELQRIIPNSKLVLFQKSGHYILLESPQLVSQEIIKFLNEVPELTHSN
jgi:pimeloyl-ACP methyl ester carboxylesterase